MNKQIINRLTHLERHIARRIPDESLNAEDSYKRMLNDVDMKISHGKPSTLTPEEAYRRMCGIAE